MKHNELVTIITKETGKTPKQQDIAKILDIPRSTVASRSSRNLNYSVEEIRKLSEYYNVDLFMTSWVENRITKDDIMKAANYEVIADFYPDIFGSCGTGTFVFSENKEIITIPKKLILNYSPSSTYSVINAYGDSMFPSIQDKDRIIVEHWNGEQIRDNKIYVFCYQDMIFVKRLIRNIDEIIVISDNPNKELYPIKKIVKDDINNVFIIGKIVGLIRNLD